jgi:hypothetical protein
MYWRVAMLEFQDCHVSGYRLCRVVDAGQILGRMMTGLECWRFAMLSWLSDFRPVGEVRPQGLSHCSHKLQ